MILEKRGKGKFFDIFAHKILYWFIIIYPKEVRKREGKKDPSSISAFPSFLYSLQSQEEKYCKNEYKIFSLLLYTRKHQRRWWKQIVVQENTSFCWAGCFFWESARLCIDSFLLYHTTAEAVNIFNKQFSSLRKNVADYIPQLPRIKF